MADDGTAQAATMVMPRSMIHCRSLTDFGELPINILVFEWSNANKKSSLELLPREDPVTDQFNVGLEL
ncbi:hypothetical protein BHM03_00056802 [Ensete ventricosum]|uniref:Uncharacterized protein n=1 Tax=Ensete ventricosum TaxID=4639 RepID=A0A445MMF9_ENSVE|nr:hypothetical protein BHM03_00056802 [Ensete ventricosum]